MGSSWFLYWTCATVGVGQYPESFAAVGGSNVIGSQHNPLDIEPLFGKVGEDRGRDVGYNR